MQLPPLPPAVYGLSFVFILHGIRFLKNEAIRCGIIVVVYRLRCRSLYASCL